MLKINKGPGKLIVKFCWIILGVVTITTNAEVTFELIQVDTMRAEGVAVKDIDGDDILDIVAGDYWYKGPNWSRTRFRDLTTTIGTPITSAGRGKLKSDFEILLDVDGDKKQDVISGSYNSPLRWYKNSSTGMWPSTNIDPTLAIFHEAELWDVDGDGVANEFVTGVNPVRWFEVSGGNVVEHVIANEAAQWGSGVGDLNGDGRPDIIRSSAWFEAPQNPRTGTWIKHCVSLGYDNHAKVFHQSDACGESEHTQQIFVMDVNNDNLMDLVTGAAHTYGFFWYEQEKINGQISFKPHSIDDSWSQVHALMLADIDSDGDQDIITGKRWYAHDGNDPGGQEPIGLYWYELNPQTPPYWTKHVISYDDGIGAGTQVAKFDMDKDGDPDFVVTTKHGGPWIIKNTTPVSVSKFEMNPFRISESKIFSTGSAVNLLQKKMNNQVFRKTNGQTVNEFNQVIGK